MVLSNVMTTAQVVETSVTVNNNSPIQDYVHPDDQTQPIFDNTLCCSSKILHQHCFELEIENKASAKFWRDYKEYYHDIFEKGLLYLPCYLFQPLTF